MSISILGMGTAVPDTCVTQQESLKIARLLVEDQPELVDTLERLYPKTQIQHRYVVHPPGFVQSLKNADEQATTLAEELQTDGGPSTATRLKLVEQAVGPLAESAAEQALSDAEIDPASVTHLVTVSSTVGSAPGFDTELIGRLGLSPNVQRTNIGLMMCQAALNGLRVAAAFAKADPNAVVLMCSLEICSAHYDLQPLPKKLVTNAIFSDGAAAVVLSASQESEWQIDLSGGHLLNSEKDGLRVGYGDHGLDIRLSTRVPGLIEKHLGPWIDSWMAQANLTRGDIQSWAIHPGGPKVLDAAANSLNLAACDLAASWEVLEMHGNMSSPTVLFILDRLRKLQAKLPCVAIAFGPGLTIEATLIGSAAAVTVQKQVA